MMHFFLEFIRHWIWKMYHRINHQIKLEILLDFSVYLIKIDVG